MYEEKKIKIPFRDIALQILIIVLFVLILLWLFPTKKNMKKYVDKNKDNKVETSEKQNTNNGKNNNGSNTGKNNNGSKNGTNTGKNNNGSNNGSGNVNTQKQYEYSKTSEGTYGNYGAWSGWSTNYVAASDTVQVETKTENGTNGYRKYYVQNGTKTENAKVGTKTNNKVLKGYDVKYVTNIEHSNEPIKNIADYLYVFTSGYITFECDNLETQIIKVLGKPAVIGEELTYDDLVKQNGDFSSYTAPASCVNPVKKYDLNYNLYQAIPIYESVTEDVYGTVTTPVFEEKIDYSYGTVTYYRYRTRSYQAGTESIKWSNSENDQNLIAQGYHFTGNVK